jgi:hypothetical protein
VTESLTVALVTETSWAVVVMVAPAVEVDPSVRMANHHTPTAIRTASGATRSGRASRRE